VCAAKDEEVHCSCQFRQTHLHFGVAGGAHGPRGVAPEAAAAVARGTEGGVECGVFGGRHAQQAAGRHGPHCAVQKRRLLHTDRTSAHQSEGNPTNTSNEVIRT